MAILFCFTSCSNNSTSSGDSYSTTDIDHSLGEEISEELKIEEADGSGGKKFSAEENNEGIYIEFAIPENTAAYWIYIDGIGKITENYFNDSRTEDDFFYPFLTPGKEYTVRVQFRKANDTDDGYEIATDNVVIGYFDITAKAGEQSKGEVFLTDLGKIQVEKNGDFKFTKKPAFENESRLTGDTYDWILEIGLCEGRSWLHTDMRYKWCMSIQIPNKEILNENYNFYTYHRDWGDITKVDFIAYRSIMNYKYKDKEYRYQWDGYTLDTNCKPESELWTDIDITNPAAVAKITGTWTREEGEEDYDYEIPIHVVYTIAITISSDTVKSWEYCTYTKLDGSAFTSEDVSKVIYYDENEYELSKDRKTLTEIFEYDEEEFSKVFDTNFDFQLFDGGKTLRITIPRSEDWKEVLDFQKQ